MSLTKPLVPALLGLALALTACPSKPQSVQSAQPAGPGPSGQDGAPQAGAPQNPGDAGGPGATGELASGEVAEVSGGGAGGAPPDGGTFEEGQGFGQLIGEGGESVTINGTLVGANNAQVDFLVISGEGDDAKPKVLHVEKVSSSSFSVKAPANYADPIYVTALVDEGGDGPSLDDKTGGATAPLKLGTEDVSVTITLGSEPAWMKSLFKPPPDGSEPGPPPSTE